MISDKKKDDRIRSILEYNLSNNLRYSVELGDRYTKMLDLDADSGENLNHNAEYL